MKIAIIYVVVTQGQNSMNYASRFCGSYLHFGIPKHEHKLIVASNGGPLSTELALMFSLFENAVFYPRVNDGGWDISAYIDVASHIDADFVICFGESVYFHRSGWLERLISERITHGPGMYGVYASYLVRPHMNTTAFACDPTFLRRYPLPKNRAERYEFEHGKNALWRRIAKEGKATKLVTWDGAYDPNQWRTPHDVLWRGNQSNCLAWCNHTERYANGPRRTQLDWARGADTLREVLQPMNRHSRPIPIPA